MIKMQRRICGQMLASAERCLRGRRPPSTTSCLSTTSSCYSSANTGEGEGGERIRGQKVPFEDPIKRTLRILKEDLQLLGKGKLTRPQGSVFPSHCDIAIIGGGIVGSSIAYWLKQRAPEALNCVVIERDPTYTRCSTTLSVGGVRQQFSLPENIQLSMFSSEFLRNVKKHLSVHDMDPPDIQFQPHGYMFLASSDGAEQLEKNYTLQKEFGARVELLSPKKLKETFPWVNTQGIALACHGLENEGWFDPWSLLDAFKRKAISLGTHYLSAEVVDFEKQETNELYVEDDDGKRHNFEFLDKIVVKTESGEHKSIKFAIAILAAGPYSGEVAKLAGIGNGPSILKVPVPVEPRKRYVYVYNCKKGPGLDCPLLIDSSGAYCRREGLGGNYLGGKSPSLSEEPEITNLDVDYSFFEKQVWPLLANRIPCFEAIKLKSAWAGYYDYNSFDQNGIVGQHPYFSNMYIATGFSGHGIQQAPGVGRAMMELILDGGFQTIDLSRFGFQRIVNNSPLYEQNIV